MTTREVIVSRGRITSYLLLTAYHGIRRPWLARSIVTTTRQVRVSGDLFDLFMWRPFSRIGDRLFCSRTWHRDSGREAEVSEVFVDAVVPFMRELAADHAMRPYDVVCESGSMSFCWYGSALWPPDLPDVDIGQGHPYEGVLTERFSLAVDRFEAGVNRRLLGV